MPFGSKSLHFSGNAFCGNQKVIVSYASEKEQEEGFLYIFSGIFQDLF